jgi:hypothetical protein
LLLLLLVMAPPPTHTQEAAPMGVEPPADMDDMLDMLGYGPMPQPPPGGCVGVGEGGWRWACAAQDTCS